MARLTATKAGRLELQNYEFNSLLKNLKITKELMLTDDDTRCLQVPNLL